MERRCTEEEIRKVCCKLPKKKCPGPDELSYEVYINAGQGMIQLVTAICNSMWREEEKPLSWTLSDIKRIYNYEIWMNINEGV